MTEETTTSEYMTYRVPCPYCKEITEVEGDPTEELIVCNHCGRPMKVTKVQS